jgi:hypothetical protein
MYLAAIPEKQWTRFVIRESYWDRGCYRSRDLVDLGGDPTEYIVYPGGRAYYVDPDLEERIVDQGGAFDADELENLLWPFVDEDVRYAVESFRRRRPTPHPEIAGGRDQAVHLFDKRRVHFLRFGHMDQGYIGRVPAKVFRPVRNRSRDEIEQYFLQSERILKPYERKAYVYVIFDLQRFFSELCAKTMPQALNQESVDNYFVQELCRLNEDRGFWAGLPVRDRLQDYLVRYLLMYFDLEYGRNDFLQNLINQFRNAHRRHRWREKKRMPIEEAGAVFGIAAAELSRMTRRQVTRHFRRRALQCHPDQGGKPTEFIRLSEAYKSIMQSKK